MSSGSKSQRRAQRAWAEAALTADHADPGAGARREQNQPGERRLVFSRPGPARDHDGGLERAETGARGGITPPRRRRRSPTARQPCCGWTEAVALRTA